MPTPPETILTALHTLLSALPATALRGDVMPERVPAAGLLILRDGEPGEPEVTLSPLRYHYQHRAEIEAVLHDECEIDHVTLQVEHSGADELLTIKVPPH